MTIFTDFKFIMDHSDEQVVYDYHIDKSLNRQLQTALFFRLQSEEKCEKRLIIPIIKLTLKREEILPWTNIQIYLHR